MWECLPIKCGVPPPVGKASFQGDQERVFPEKVTYTLETGYTLNGKFDGDSSFDIECQADGTFTSTRDPKPVKCGVEAKRDFATNPGEPHTYMEIAPFTCRGGYSVDAKADGPITFETTCKETGKYTPHDDCKPVECGPVKPPANTEQTADGDKGKLASLVFKQRATFKCKPGYTLDGFLDGAVKLSTSCQADGTIEEHPGCINADDCASTLCDKNGKCVDHKDPTGEHHDDYHCDCDSGFEQKTDSTGHHYCSNVPDCPVSPTVACEPGSCHDLINDYTCECPDGYDEKANPDDSLKHDCMPRLCGKPPAVEHATTPVTKDIYYDSPPVMYACSKGYSLDASALGDFIFSRTCKADKSFSSHASCKAIKCGTLPSIDHAKYDATTSFEFPEKPEYACDEGYSVDGKASGAKKFVAPCESTGEFSGVAQCDPVACPTIPTQPEADYDMSAMLVYPQTTPVECNEGFALDKDKHDEKKYTIECKSDGKLDIPHNGCVAVDCGALPEVENAKVSGSTTFGTKATVTCNTGYSIDQTTAPESESFDFICQSTGKFEETKDCKRIKCGKGPAVEHTKRDTGVKVFEDTVKYTLDEGYTLNGKHDGPKEFTISCQGDGTFTATEVTKPVECGVAPVLPHCSNLGIPRTYHQNAMYTCEMGFSVDGSANGLKEFETLCNADSSFAKHDGCQPVKCGEPPVPLDSSQSGGPSELVFKDVAEFKCDTGFSVDSKLSGETTMSTH
jgi:Notch-like protein